MRMRRFHTEYILSVIIPRIITELLSFLMGKSLAHETRVGFYLAETFLAVVVAKAAAPCMRSRYHCITLAVHW